MNDFSLLGNVGQFSLLADFGQSVFGMLVIFFLGCVGIKKMLGNVSPEIKSVAKDAATKKAMGFISKLMK